MTEFAAAGTQPYVSCILSLIHLQLSHSLHSPSIPSSTLIVILKLIQLKNKRYTRSGRTVHMPHVIGHLFGRSFLDGEMWFGRGFFSESQVMLSGELVITDWSNLRYDDVWRGRGKVEVWSVLIFDLYLIRLVVFDDPFYKMHHLPFEKRYAQLLRNTQPEHPVIVSFVLVLLVSCSLFFFFFFVFMLFCICYIFQYYL